MCYVQIRIVLENRLGSQKSAISEREMAVLGPKNVLFPDKHSRELPGSCFDILQSFYQQIGGQNQRCHPEDVGISMYTSAVEIWEEGLEGCLTTNFGWSARRRSARGYWIG